MYGPYTKSRPKAKAHVSQTLPEHTDQVMGGPRME